MGPFFVVGSSRSGTTMMGRIIGLHTKVFTFHELHFFEQLWDGESLKVLSRAEAIHLAGRLIGVQRDGYLRGPKPTRYLREAGGIVANEGIAAPALFERFLWYETRRMKRVIPCDQTPRNVFYIGEMLAQFPEARIVNMVRDPRDVLLSQKRKWRRRYLGAARIPLREAVRSWVNYHPVAVSRLWLASVKAAAKWSQHPRLFTVRFEDLVTQAHATVRAVCAFLGLDYTGKMLDVPVIGSSARADSPVRRGIDGTTSGRWRGGGLDPAEVRICERIARAGMQLHGYEPSSTGGHWMAVGCKYGTMPMKVGTSLLLNLHRMQHPGKAIRRRLVR